MENIAILRCIVTNIQLLRRIVFHIVSIPVADPCIPYLYERNALLFYPTAKIYMVDGISSCVSLLG